MTLRTRLVHFSLLTVFWLIRQAEMQDTTFVHVCALDKETYQESQCGLLFPICGSCLVKQASVWLSVTICCAFDRSLTILLYANIFKIKSYDKLRRNNADHFYFLVPDFVYYSKFK